MSFLRQLFGITRRNPTVQKLARPNHETLVTAMITRDIGSLIIK